MFMRLNFLLECKALRRAVTQALSLNRKNKGMEFGDRRSDIKL